MFTSFYIVPEAATHQYLLKNFRLFLCGAPHQYDFFFWFHKAWRDKNIKVKSKRTILKKFMFYYSIFLSKKGKRNLLPSSTFLLASPNQKIKHNKTNKISNQQKRLLFSKNFLASSIQYKNAFSCATNVGMWTINFCTVFCLTFEWWKKEIQHNRKQLFCLRWRNMKQKKLLPNINFLFFLTPTNHRTIKHFEEKQWYWTKTVKLSAQDTR